MNKGVSLTTGDVVGFLHSDDLYASDDTLELVAEELQADDIDGVYGDLIYTAKYDTSKIIRYWKSCDFKMSLLTQGWMPAHPTLFLKKEVYNRFGDFDLEFKIAGDYDFMLRVLKSGIKVKYISKILYVMRMGGESNKSIKNIMLKSKEDLRALKKNHIGGIKALLTKNLSKIKQFIKK